MKADTTPPTSGAWPTATHDVPAAQDTPSRELPVSSESRADRRLHDLPFQTSARARLGVSLVYSNWPVAEGQDTWVKNAVVEPSGTGNDSFFQTFPFQESAMVIPTAPTVKAPTATQKLAAGHETPSSPGPMIGSVPPLGSGRFWT